MSGFGMFSGGIPSSLRKLIGINSNASEIDALSKQGLRKIQKLMRSSANGEISNLTVMLVGDSILNNSYNKVPEYMQTQVAKIGAIVYNNAYSGQTAQNWLGNTGGSTISQAISNATGTGGENTIIFYNFAINDYNSYGPTAATTSVTNGISALIAALPKASIVLIQPIASENSTRDAYLRNLYNTISSTYSLPIAKTYDSGCLNDAIHSNSDYYFDAYHPTEWGSRRLVNFLLDFIMPLELFSIVTLEEKSQASIADFNLHPEIDTIDKYWNVSTIPSQMGTDQSAVGWRRLKSIAVEPNFQVRIRHQGNQSNTMFLDANGLGVQLTTLTKDANGDRFKIVPAGAYQMRINVSNQGSTYDALNDIVEVEYYNPYAGTYLNIKNINNGLNIRNIINKFRDGILVDDYGKTGAIGQTLTIDSSSKMSWS